MLSQGTINLLNFLWTTFHDFFYLGAYYLATHFHLVKKQRSLEERVEAIEQAAGLPKM